MAYKSGLQTKLGAKIESIWGTAVAVGAGDRFICATLTADDGRSFEANAEELVPYNTRTIETAGQPNVALEGIQPIYHGFIDLLVATLLGKRLGTTQPNSLVGAYRRTYAPLHPTPTESLTLAWSLNPSIEVMEAPGAMPQSMRIEWPENAEATVNGSLLTGTHTNNGTNGSTEMDALTFAAGCGEAGLMHTKHFEVKLAREGSSLVTVQVKSASLEITNGLSEDNKVTKNAAGVTDTQPQRTGKLQATLTLQLATEADSAYGQGWDDNAVYRATLKATDTYGAPGKSRSGTNPATDLSGLGSSGDLKITLIDGEAAQTVTLSLASLTTGSAIAAALQAAIRSLTPSDPSYSNAYSGCTVTYNGSPPNDYYEITPGGHHGALSKPVVTDGTTNNIADDLKLGTANGGTEQAGLYNFLKIWLPELRFSDRYTGRDIDGVGRTQPTLQFVATACWYANGESAPTGFGASDDTDLDYDCESELVIAIQNERSSNPF